MAYIYNMADTWADAGVTFTAIKMNVLDTASAAGSLLMDLQVGGVSKFSVTKSTVNSTVIQLNSNGGIANIEAFGNSLTLAGNGGHNISLPAATFQRAGVGYGFFLGTGTTANSPVLYGNAQEANHTIAQRNGTNAQTFRVYNTFTDASNYERGKMEWSSNVLRIGTEKAGTGTARNLELQTDGTTRVTIASTGNVTTSSAVIVGGDIYLSGLSTVALRGSSSGVVLIANTSFTDFTRLQLGGTTNSFGAIARDGAGVSFVGAAGGSTAHIKVPGVTVANLPAAATAGAGARSFVTDALVPVFGSAVAGGGAVPVPVYSTGSAWNVG